MNRIPVLLVAGALFTCAPAAVAQVQRSRITYRGATLAQWLDPAFVPTEYRPQKLFADKATRADALAAFGVKGDPKQFLLEALAGADDLGPVVAILLPVVQDMPDARDYADALLQRWRRRPDDGAVLGALLQVAPETWPTVSGEARRAVAAQPVLTNQLLAAIPPSCALDEDWQELLASVLDTAKSRNPRVLPTQPPILTRCRHWQEELANGGLLDTMDYDTIQPDSAVLGRHVEGLATRLQHELGLRARPTIWDCDGGSDFPRHAARTLGGAGTAAIPVIEALLATGKPDQVYAGQLALGELARAEAAQAPKVLAELRSAGNRPLEPMQCLQIAEMCRIAGPTMVPLLIAALRDKKAQVVDLALASLLLMHGQSMNCADPVPVAAKPLASELSRRLLQSLFDGEARFLDHRTLAVQLAAVLERARPMTDTEFSAWEKKALAATTMTTDLYLDACRCVEYRGDWLQYISVRCKGEVKDLLLAIAVRSPSFDPWDPMRGIQMPSWHSRVLSLDRGSANESLPHEHIDRLARLDPDLFVRDFARQCLSR